MGESGTSGRDDEDNNLSKAPKRRTKSGCLTCRRRRIKCGEEKPACRNCTKTKRVCEQPPLPGSSAWNSRQAKKHESSTSSKHTTTQIHEDEILPLRSNLTLEVTKARNITRKGAGVASSFSGSHSQGSVESQSPEDFIAALLPGASDIAAQYSADVYGGTPSGQSLSSSYPLSQDQFIPTPAKFLESPAIGFSGDDYFSSNLSGYTSQVLHTPTDILQIQQAQEILHRDLSMRHFQSSNTPSDEFPLRGTSRTNSSADADETSTRITKTLAVRRPPSPQLTELQQSHFRHFIDHVNINFTSLEEDAVGLPINIRASNFWTFVIPSMAVQSPALLHAVLAIAALHKANTLNQSEHVALLDYHRSIRKLAKGFGEPGASDRDDLLATCLILAYFETMSGETVKWGRHLQGSCDLVRQRIIREYSANDVGRYKYTAKPSLGSHLVWFHIHQDTIQSILSGNGLFLELEYIERCAIRGAPGSVTHTSDQLRVFVARISDFVAKDRQRKEEGLLDDLSVQTAVAAWTNLKSMLTVWASELAPEYHSTVIASTKTPFGDVLIFNHPSIASIRIMYLAMLIHLERSHPELSAVPAEAIKQTAAKTAAISNNIIQILSGIMVDAVNNTSTEHGLHLKAMINAVLPAFMAGMTVRVPEQRDYLERMLHDVYSFTGWRTVCRVLQGLDVAWQRPPRMFDGLPSIDRGLGVQRERTSLAPSGPHDSMTKQYVLMDKPQIINAAIGLLGKLSIVEGLAGQGPSPDANPISPELHVDHRLMLDELPTDMAYSVRGPVMGEATTNTTTTAVPKIAHSRRALPPDLELPAYHHGGGSGSSGGYGQGVAEMIFQPSTVSW